MLRGSNLSEVKRAQFAKLAEQYRDLIYMFAKKISSKFPSDSETVDDCVSFLTTYLYERFELFDEERASFMTWAHMWLRSGCNRIYKEQWTLKRRGNLETLRLDALKTLSGTAYDVKDERYRPDKGTDSVLPEEVYTSLATLTEDELDVVKNCIMQDTKLTDYAASRGITHGAARSSRTRALDKLKKLAIPDKTRKTSKTSALSENLAHNGR